MIFSARVIQRTLRLEVVVLGPVEFIDAAGFIVVPLL